MKKKINLRLIVIAMIAIFSSVLLVAAVSYDLFRRQILEDLKIYARLLQNAAAVEGDAFAGHYFSGDGVRITVVDGNGEVVSENYAPELKMGNHAGRPEVMQAWETGEGKAVRRSSTLGKNAFYYAVRTEDGGVIRVSREADSLWSLLTEAFPFLALMMGMLIAFCLVIAHFLTKSLVEPIGKIAGHINDLEGLDIYEELEPFVATIKSQHEDILRNAGMRQEFTANVSHELKTPLAAISGYSELIENGMAPEEDMVRFAKEIHRNSSRLLTLIDDVIRLSELDAAEQEVCREIIDLSGIARICAGMLQMNAEKHGVELHFAGMSALVYSEKQMMEELVYNLCDNAIRYNRDGGQVWVKAETEENRAVLTVEDNGIGIPKEHQERIFERFYRVDKSRSKSTGGTGLGLAIVKHIVAKNNAEIELESEEGKGTKVTVRFPVLPSAGQTGKPRSGISSKR